MTEKIWSEPEVFRIPVELPQNPLRNLNSYVICSEGDSLVIDTGFHRPECRKALWTGLEELGIDLTKTALFLTHFHSDHSGLVWDFVERGIPVYMGRVERDYYEKLTAAGNTAALHPLFLTEGFPPEQLELQATGNQARMYAPKPNFPAIPLEDGESLRIGTVSFTVIHTPGHTPGHMVLYLPVAELLFSGDHILFDITPNISVWPDIPYSLSDYLESLQKIRKLPIKAAFPAHREAGTDTRLRIDQLTAHHARRLDEVFRAISENPGITAYDTAGHISWSVRGLSWDAFPPHQRWFTMGETVAHLYELVHTGRVIRQQRADKVRYFTGSKRT